MIEKITKLLKEAMKEKDLLKINVYRSLKADIETAKHSGNTDELAIIAKAKKKRLDAASEFEKCGRTDLMEIEIIESDIITSLLPKEPTDEEIMNCIQECCGNVSMQMGVIIKYVKETYPTIDGKKLAGMVKSFISK